MSSCPFRRQKSSGRLLDGNSTSPIRQESVHAAVGEEDADPLTLNLKVLNEAVRLLTAPGVSVFLFFV